MIVILKELYMNEEAIRILKKYPERIPVILIKNKDSNIPNINKTKYLVPKDMKMSQFIFTIRRNLTIKPEQALFFIINNKVPSSIDSIGQIYSNDKNDDGFLYVIYSNENTFG